MLGIISYSLEVFAGLIVETSYDILITIYIGEQVYSWSVSICTCVRKIPAYTLLRMLTGVYRGWLSFRIISDPFLLERTSYI